MCRQVTCKTCGKTTWAGCGQHIDTVMRSVPARDRCQGHEKMPSKGIFARIFGR